MARKIIQRGNNALYIERRAQNVEDDGREVIQEGEKPRYEEYAEGEDAEYQEFAHGQASQPQHEEGHRKDDIKEYQKAVVRKLLMDNAEYVEPTVVAEYAEVSPLTVETADAGKMDYSASIAECFRVTNEFVRQSVFAVVKDYYMGAAARLALIEITLFDHNLLRKRNSHTAFLKSLVAWGIVSVADENELKKIVSALADKHKRLPETGYKEWGEDYVNDKVCCENIGIKLGPTIPYNR